MSGANQDAGELWNRMLAGIAAIRLRVRNQRVVETLRSLTAQGKIQRNTRGFAISSKGDMTVQISL
jgi:hypothetical protein